MQVADGGPAPLTVLVIVYGMAKDFGLVCRVCIDGDFRKAGTGHKPFLGRRIPGLLIQDVILGSDVAGGLGLIEPVDGRQDISILPARREIGVKIRFRWLKKQSSIDGAGTADGATHESVHLVGATGQIGWTGKNGIIEPGYVDTAQICADQPLRSLGASGDAVGWPASLEEEDFLRSALTQPARDDDPRGTGTDYDDIP